MTNGDPLGMTKPMSAKRMVCEGPKSSIFLDADDPQMLSIVLKIKDQENLHGFTERMQSEEMEKIMEEAGASGDTEAMYVFGRAEETTV